jgi:hypothetical protein
MGGLKKLSLITKSAGINVNPRKTPEHILGAAAKAEAEHLLKPRSLWIYWVHFCKWRSINRISSGCWHVHSWLKKPSLITKTININLGAALWPIDAA